MRYSKGKWTASNKDTYSVETTLNKIILAHLNKLYACLKKSECHGVPMHYVSIQADIQGVDKWSERVDIDEADELRFKDLEELIWVFGDNEPKIEDYIFDIKMISGEPNEKGHIPVTFETTGEEERDRYHKDCTEHWERREKGYELFGKIYNTLSW